DARIVAVRAGAAVRDPVGEQLVFRRVRFEALAALVRNRLRGLEQHQAARGIFEANAPAPRGFGDRDEIAVVIVAAQRKLEAALSRRRAVARAGRAAVADEDRLDLVAKGNFVSARKLLRDQKREHAKRKRGFLSKKS